jgi:DNA (cytosine-5)-methyltransferase 1
MRRDTTTVKILNLYAGIGGNRKLWGDEHEIVAVESNQSIADVYKAFFPNDTVIVGDAHEYLRLHYKQFDFIWSSPPCQTHGSFRFNIGVRFRGVEPKYPDMTLYEEIIFLKHHATVPWVVENVKPYYHPLIQPTAELQRHLFWANFEILHREFPKEKLRQIQIPELQKLHGFDLEAHKLPNKRQVLRNCVSPALGEHILRALTNQDT